MVMVDRKQIWFHFGQYYSSKSRLSIANRQTSQKINHEYFEKLIAHPWATQKDGPGDCFAKFARKDIHIK